MAGKRYESLIGVTQAKGSERKILAYQSRNQERKSSMASEGFANEMYVSSSTDKTN